MRTRLSCIFKGSLSMCYNLNPHEKMERVNIQLSVPFLSNGLGRKNVSFSLFHFLQLQPQKCAEHTQHPYSVVYTAMSAHCLPTRKIRGRAATTVGAIYRSNSAEFLQISDTDLQHPLHPTGTSTYLLFTQNLCTFVTLGV